MKEKESNLKRKITKIIGIILFALVVIVTVALDLNERDFRALALCSLLIFGMVWSEQYETIIAIIGFIVLLLLLWFGSHVRF
ncbi:hypothetical protein [Enterococcus wangshanyuanii]|uniref:Uncharacterized protein n=1 Tax=Enterococcus wangshanyuanii TaxID=2005703 RepID=A0ABQ1PV78_9ENTE|nr:hypothetical protein [Enterococcus wangshanyuanii]GGD04458.1 hypothetical protein GCM10011573_37450 [Enterococcus wangshanyuanii]